MTSSEIDAAVLALVAESLALPKDRVRLDSRLTEDLGADSLDFIDMIFMVEKKFEIKVRDSELDFLSRLDFSSPAVMRDGVLTAETVERLSGWLPALKAVDDLGRVTPGQLFSMITVETLSILVQRKLGSR